MLHSLRRQSLEFIFLFTLSFVVKVLAEAGRRRAPSGGQVGVVSLNIGHAMRGVSARARLGTFSALRLQVDHADGLASSIAKNVVGGYNHSRDHQQGHDDNYDDENYIAAFLIVANKILKGPVILNVGGKK